MSNISASLAPSFTGCDKNVSTDEICSIAHQHSADATPSRPLSQHLPPFDAIELALAARFHDIAGIDAITDKLADAGLARPRTDVSQLEVLRAGLRQRFGGRS